MKNIARTFLNSPIKMCFPNAYKTKVARFQLLSSSRSRRIIPLISSAALGAVFSFVLTFFLMKASFESTANSSSNKIISGDQNQNCPNPSFINKAHHLENVGITSYMSSIEDFEDNSIAKDLQKQVRVLCWVLTSPVNHFKKAKHVKATWGKRCNILLFMSSTNDTYLPSIGLPVEEGRSNLWAKTKEAFKYVYNNYFDEADWFLKADDDSYVILENLRYMLSHYNTSDPLYFGCRFRPLVKMGYMGGGAGYVLSKEALSRFIKKALPDGKKCRPGHKGSEDVEIGKCLDNVNVRSVDTRDRRGRSRFFTFTPDNYIVPNRFGPDFWHWKWIYYPSLEGKGSCSELAISFHYVSPMQLYVLDYLIYELRPYGINRAFEFSRADRRKTFQ